MKRERIPDILAEIKGEMEGLERVVKEIREVYESRPLSEKERNIYNESLALKIHNFYTGCERIFHIIADDVNGGIPASYDWHKRLLKGMTLEIEGIRPPVLSKKTFSELEEYLAFRHVVRNIYGYELDPERLQKLAARVHGVFEGFKADIGRFIAFLKKLSE